MEQIEFVEQVMDDAMDGKLSSSPYHATACCVNGH